MTKLYVDQKSDKETNLIETEQMHKIYQSDSRYTPAVIHEVSFFLSAFDFKTRKTIIMVTQWFARRFQYNLYSMEGALNTCIYDMPNVYWPY